MLKAINLSLFIVFLSGVCFAKNIAICTVATGDKAWFIKKFVESARKNFLPESNLTFFIFTDQILPIHGDDIRIIRWPHKPEPYSSLMEFKAFATLEGCLDRSDYVYACSPSIEFTYEVGQNILGNLVGTVHQKNTDTMLMPNTHLLCEYNCQSVLGVDPYFAVRWGEEFNNEFYGGTAEEFKRVVATCSATIAEDLKNEIFSVDLCSKHLSHFFWHKAPDVKLISSHGELAMFKKNNDLNYEKEEIARFQKKIVNADKLLMGDREFVILIPSYNNIENYKGNLDSVYKQTYGKYRVIYIDDNSADGTGKAVEEYVCALGKKSITTIIHNSERQLAMANIYNTIHNYCHDHEIIVMLDGDDEFANENVLAYLNDVYKQGYIWLTYGNLWLKKEKTICSWSKKIDSTQVELNRFREWDGSVTALRTFGAWLFKRINKKDLLWGDDFFKMAYDVAMFTPMIEMAGHNHCFIDKILYLYNDNSPINDHMVDRKLQLELNKYIRTEMPKYHQISGIEYFEKIFQSKIDADCKDIVEIACLLNDFIAVISQVYNNFHDIETILSKIIFLQPDFIHKSHLWQIACQQEYFYLKGYLSKKECSLCNCQKRKYYRCKYELDSEPIPSINRIKFANWLWDLIVDKYCLKPTTLAEDVHRKNIDGLTPLISATALGLPDLVEEILSFGVDKDAQLTDGKRAIDFAFNRKEPWFQDIVKMLK